MGWYGAAAPPGLEGLVCVLLLGVGGDGVAMCQRGYSSMGEKISVPVAVVVGKGWGGGNGQGKDEDEKTGSTESQGSWAWQQVEAGMRV